MVIATQRQWKRRVIKCRVSACGCLCLFGLFTLVVLLAHHLYGDIMPIRQCAWHAKEEATFVAVRAVVRRGIWRTQLV